MAVLQEVQAVQVIQRRKNQHILQVMTVTAVLQATVRAVHLLREEVLRHLTVHLLQEATVRDSHHLQAVQPIQAIRLRPVREKRLRVVEKHSKFFKVGKVTLFDLFAVMV